VASGKLELKKLEFKHTKKKLSAPENLERCLLAKLDFK
jgi:hypothetical protein